MSTAATAAAIGRPPCALLDVPSSGFFFRSFFQEINMFDDMLEPRWSRILWLAMIDLCLRCHYRHWSSSQYPPIIALPNEQKTKNLYKLEVGLLMFDKRNKSGKRVAYKFTPE